VSRELPDGLPGHENAYPVKIGSSELDAIIFGKENNIVSIGLFLRQGTYTPSRTIAGMSGKYSRKTPEINKIGEITEDSVGVMPEFDLTDNEPDFDNISKEEIAVEVVRQIKAFKRPAVN
jgi:hypothetical protein